MIRVEGLRAGYRAGFRRRWREIIQGISFHVPRGSIVGYLGVNGAGKTTTIKVLVGVNAPSAGTVEIGGHPVATRQARLLLGFSPEAPRFYEGLTAHELLDFYGRLSGMAVDERGRRAKEVLAEVDLEDVTDQQVRGFSKGMRQRLGLAQALIHDPELLILDEPLDGLDPMGRLHLRKLIASQKEKGKTVFFSSHVLSDVEAVSDRLIVLDRGKIAYEGPTEGFGGEVSHDVNIVIGGWSGEAAASALESAAGSSPTPAGEGRWEIRCSDPAAADRVVDAARAAGGRILSLTSRRPTLEETFMKTFGAPEDTVPVSGGAEESP